MTLILFLFSLFSLCEAETYYNAARNYRLADSKAYGYNVRSTKDLTLCNPVTSGWSGWYPTQCTKCSQNRYRYCLGAYSGCGYNFCMGTTLEKCSSNCQISDLKLRDPRVSLSTSNNHCGTKTHFACPSGYKLTGPLSSECLVNSTWSDTAPRCTRATCDTPVPIKHGYRTWGSNFGAQAIYKCYMGHQLAGQGTLTCSIEGIWLPNQPPTCQPVRCPHINSPRDGYAYALSRTYRSIAYFRCRIGYDMHGPRSTRCGPSGQWSSSAPSCVRRIRYN